MTTTILENIINDFNLNLFEEFFRQKNDNYEPVEHELSQFDNELFCNVKQLGQMQCGNIDVAVFSCRVEKNLTERSSKKAQYVLGKKILRQLSRYAGGFFIFYDANCNFRFSFIYSLPRADGRQDWSNFRRYTYYVSKDQTNKTFKQQMVAGDFNSIDSIIDAFSVEKVTREFYQEIANWYFWALKNVKFPQDVENEPNGKEMAVIRLITRLIFIWFMKIEGLIPAQLFDEIFIKDILKNYKPNNDDYYKAILQNLFFATLNTKQENRRFRSNIRGHKGYNPDFGNNYVYRYEDLFKESEKIIKEYFLQIPFLNGGLFECLDHKSKDELRYIDGFTDVVKHQPKIPNYLFFSNEEIVDLNSDYGTKNKKYKVRGLINIFRSYNFTINENTYDDAEVALDPELLGKIFENLLASYNPETAKTARKETGSYYTPREIVDYMVEQSLREYFKTNMYSINDKELDELFSPINEGKSINLDEYTKKSLIELIYNLRVLDPAVGSGAFPMGMLHKLVLLLQKLDPDNEQWKTMQIEDVKRNIKDPTLVSKFIKQIEENFAEKNDDYGRKLYLIEKCLYGVDIQPIAIEIARLRFFISLLVDEKINKNKENYGIEPLPNLDFKLMQGNSLITSFYGIDLRYNESIKTLREKLNPKITNLEILKHQYQYACDVKDKKDLMESIENSILDIFKTYIEIYFQHHLSYIKNSFIFENKELMEGELKNYYKQEGFDIEKAIDELKDYIELKKPKNFFLWNIFFAEVFNEKGGFDIVIGNPPYVSTKGVMEKEKPILGKIYGFADDLYSHFYFKGIELLKGNGILTYISSKTFWTIQTKKNLREFLLKNKLIQIIDTANPFESAMVDTCITIVQKEANDKNIIRFIDVKNGWENIKEYQVEPQLYKDMVNNVFFIPTKFNLKVYERLGKIVKQLMDKWWDKIDTSKNIEKNKRELEQYRNSLKPGDITLLGLITEGGQGLATANNGKYVGVLEGTKWADNVRKQRPEKLLLATNFCKKEGIRTKADAQSLLNKLNENEIRKLFDDLKEKYGRDIFGQGWLYRIVSPDEIANVDTLTDDEKLNGIKGEKTFVPYDKGDKDGNRWYAPTPYYIDWSRENVKILQTDPKARWQGYQFYFREGFCWTDVNSTYLKSRLKENGVYDVLTMSLFTSTAYPDWYFVCMINSKFISEYVDDFVNSTSHFQINDARQLPIIIPTTEQLMVFEDIFNSAVSVQKEKFAGKLSEQNAEAKLADIQRELDERVLEMYGVR